MISLSGKEDESQFLYLFICTFKYSNLSLFNYMNIIINGTFFCMPLQFRILNGVSSEGSHRDIWFGARNLQVLKYGFDLMLKYWNLRNNLMKILKKVTMDFHLEILHQQQYFVPPALWAWLLAFSYPGILWRRRYLLVYRTAFQYVLI